MKTILTFIVVLAFSVPSFAQHDHENPHNPVELNKGEKWKANPETTQGIKDMQKRLTAFHSGEKKNTKELHLQLLEDFQGIFSKCTMKGAAHDQLHNYLLPLRDMLHELETCDDCAHTIEHIDKHLSEFSEYFQ